MQRKALLCSNNDNNHDDDKQDSDIDICFNDHLFPTLILPSNCCVTCDTLPQDV